LLALNAQLKDLYAQLENCSEELKAEIEAQIAAVEAKIAEVKAKIEEVKAQIIELNAKVEATIAQAKAEIEAKIAEVEAKIAELKAQAEAIVAAAKAEIEAKIAEIEAKVAELKAEVEAKLAEIDATIKAEIERVKAEIEAKIAEIEAKIEAIIEEINAEVEAKIAELKAKVEEEIAKIKEAVEEEVAKIKAAAEAQIEKLNDAIKDVVDDFVADVKAELKETLDTLDAMVEAAVAGEVEKLKAMAESLIEQAETFVEGEIQKVVDAYNDAYVDATTDDLELLNHDDYVALGDSSAVSVSYVDSFAAEIEKEYGVKLDVTNLADATHTIENIYDVIAGNTEAITEAELVTIGYGNGAFADAAMNRLYDALRTGVIEEYNWVELVGEEVAAKVVEVLTDVNAELVEAGMDTTLPIPAFGKATLAEAMTLAVEAFAYETVSYAVELPSAIAAIREVNPDAVVIVVGMYNPFKNSTFVFGDTTIEIGEYVDELVDIANKYSTALCMLTGSAIFVEAPEAETDLANKEIEATDFIISYLFEKTVDFTPNETGHAYITSQLLNALNIEVPYLYGDVNLDKKVNVADAAMAYQIAIGAYQPTRLQEISADVSGNGKVQVNDASMIYQYAIGVLPAFPVEA